jgi:hypothetical protein
LLGVEVGTSRIIFVSFSAIPEYALNIYSLIQKSKTLFFEEAIYLKFHSHFLYVCSTYLSSEKVEFGFVKNTSILSTSGPAVPLIVTSPVVSRSSEISSKLRGEFASIGTICMRAVFSIISTSKLSSTCALQDAVIV